MMRVGQIRSQGMDTQTGQTIGSIMQNQNVGQMRVMRAIPDNTALMMQRQTMRRMQRGNLRSAIFDNVQTRPAVINNEMLSEGYGVPAYRMPLERSIKPLPTLPYIVGNTTYDPHMKVKPMETPGTTFIRGQLMNSRNMKPMLEPGIGDPSKTNPTVL
jgi:hypothetical protein